MEPQEFDPYEIKYYFNIDDRISRIKSRIRSLRERFYDQTMETRVMYTDLGVAAAAFNIEKNVIPYLDTVLVCEKAIEVLLKRKRYLNDYLHSLDLDEKEYLVNKYSGRNIHRNKDQADLNLFEEILEINEAINSMYGFPDETLEINNARLEDDFTAIAALLGV
jgi:hypothetical protein